MNKVVWTDGIYKDIGFYKTASKEKLIAIIDKIIEMETKVNNRTGIDFSNHELIIEDKEGLLIHTLKRPEFEMRGRINFINTNDVMVVTGDYGNWMFCREFHPSAEGGVSDGYWHEKLQTKSTQDGLEFDSERTFEEIKEGLNGGLEEYGYEGKKLEEVKEYYSDLLVYVDEPQSIYEAYAYSNFPYFLCGEDVPNVKKTKQWLRIVFDGFDEICRRMKEEYVENSCEVCGEIGEQRNSNKNSVLCAPHYIEPILAGFDTKHELGFTQAEFKEIISNLPKINMKKVNDAMFGNTCAMIDEEIIYYHCDVRSAIYCGVENRDQTIAEWD